MASAIAFESDDGEAGDRRDVRAVRREQRCCRSRLRKQQVSGLGLQSSRCVSVGSRRRRRPVVAAARRRGRAAHDAEAWRIARAGVVGSATRCCTASRARAPASRLWTYLAPRAHDRAVRDTFVGRHGRRLLARWPLGGLFDDEGEPDEALDSGISVGCSARVHREAVRHAEARALVPGREGALLRPERHPVRVRWHHDRTVRIRQCRESSEEAAGGAARRADPTTTSPRTAGSWA